MTEEERNYKENSPIIYPDFNWFLMCNYCDTDIISDKIIYLTAMDKVNKGLRIWKQAEEIFIFLNYLRAKCLVFCTTRMTSKFTLEKWRGAGGEDSVLSHPNHKTENANKDLWLCICRQAEIVLHQCSSRKSQTRATIKSFEERAPFYGFQLLCSVQLVSVQYNQTHWWLGDPVTLTGPR